MWWAGCFGFHFGSRLSKVESKDIKSTHPPRSALGVIPVPRTFEIITEAMFPQVHLHGVSCRYTRGSQLVFPIGTLDELVFPSGTP